MIKMISLLLMASLLISCDTNNPAPDEIAKPFNLTAVQKQRVVQDNEFAFDLMNQTLANTSEKNVFISPLSVSIALGMARNGAIGVTKTEMETALKMNGLTDAEINTYYKLMQNTLPDLDPKTKLSIANSIWYRNTFDVKADFLKTNQDFFSSKVAALDFNSPKAVETINNWCSDNTNGLIPEVIQTIDPEQMMFLINAIYFKGTWIKQFDKKDTHEATFTNELNQPVKVNMMNKTDSFAYADDELAQYLDLPYGNNAFSMTVILPKGNNKASDIFKTITPENFNQLLNQLESQKVIVSLPRFKVKNKFKLNSMLQSMGMPKAFQENAEFDNISMLKPLYIGFVQHDTYVEVTEEGTEAAAVTTIGFETTSMPANPYFVVNKPFVFIIREKSSGVILFMGKIGNVEKF